MIVNLGMTAGRAHGAMQGAGKGPCRLCKGKGFLMHKGKDGPEKRVCPHCGGGKKNGLRTK